MVINRRQFQIALLICACSVINSPGQTSRIVPFNDGQLDNTVSISTIAYHPEPIIFVHGITASRVKWEGVISNLHQFAWFQSYQYDSNSVRIAKESTAPPTEGYAETELSGTFPTGEKNQWREIEQPYLHTFNYGRHAKRLPDGTTRAWTRVRVSRQSHDLVETNAWQAPVSDYLQGRVTLNQRVEAIRAAYEIAGQPRRDVILIGQREAI